MDKHKWEYFRLLFKDGYVYSGLGATVASEPQKGEEILNLLGDDGWEIIAVAHTDAETYTLFFKRPKT